jgi:hypothetical protein
VRRRLLTTVLLVLVGVLAALAAVAFFVARDDATVGASVCRPCAWPSTS